MLDVLEELIIIRTPRYRLVNGREMPGFALGTFLGFGENGVIESKNKRVRDVVAEAIDIGYRHFDTASIYGTEDEVGEAINMKISEKIINRENVYVTTKLWNTAHTKEQVYNAAKETLKKTGLDYVDLYLMHWPIGLNEDYSYSDVDYLETWLGMEEVQRLGLAKSIGVSNFNKEQLQRLLSKCTIKPVALQIEMHPQLIQQELMDFCKSEKIIVMGYIPFESLVSRFGIDIPGPRMNDPLLMKLGKKYKKTPIQIVLRWAVDRGVVPLEKTLTHAHLVENLEIFDFQLLPEEILQINRFDSNTRFTRPSYWQDHPHYPFDKEDNPISDSFKSSPTSISASSSTAASSSSAVSSSSSTASSSP